MIKRVILAGILVAGSANAGMFDSVTSAVGGGTSAKEISGDALSSTIKNYITAKSLVQKSSDILASALLSKEDAAKFEAAMKAAETISDPKEKEAAVSKVISDEQTAIKIAAESKETEAKLKKADAKTKQLVAAGGFNFMLSGLKYKDTLASAKDMVSSLSSNPTSAMKYASELGQLKDMVATLPDSVTSMASVGGKLVDLFKKGGVKFTPPVDSKQAPKESNK